MYVENTQGGNAPMPESLTLGLYDLSLAVSQSACISASVTPSNATNYTIVWSSSNPNVASVNAGTVNALAVGSTTITVRIPEANLTACCDVEVTPFVPVESISITPEVVSVAVDQMICLEAEVCPTNATKPMPAWSSSNEEIATVGQYSGLVHAHKVGSVTITATSENGENEKSDQCIVNVHAPIPVAGISIAQENVTMNEGEYYQLQANVVPENATNKTVIWETSDETVATVGMLTGMVHALHNGDVTITAKTADGDFHIDIPVKFYRDSVFIGQDDSDSYGPHTTVQFASSENIWRCVGVDLIHSDISGGVHANRSRDNYFKDFNNSTTEINEYSDDELRLLYAIDPHGVADYVQRFAHEFGGDFDGLDYKDHIFSVIFGQEPKYYMRDANGKWRVTDYRDNLKYVLSESECLFGEHAIYDFYFWTHILNAVVELVFDIIDFAVDCAVGVDVPVDALLSAGMRALIGAGESPMTVVADYAISAAPGTALDQYVASFKVDLGWVGDVASIPGIFMDFLENISSAYVNKLPFYNGMIDYCLNSVGYNVFVQKGQNSQSLAKIREMLNEAAGNQ